MSTATTSRSRKSKTSPLNEGEYTVDELAQRTNCTVRNIRAYQDKGVLPHPEKRGRLGVYNEAHVSRLQLINNLLDRGFSIGNINELLEAWAQGRELGDVLGLEHAITHVFSSETPKNYNAAQLLKMFGLGAARKKLLDEAAQLGLVRREGTKFISDSPSLVERGAELIELGVPFEELLELMRLLRGNVQRAADGLVDIAFKRFDTYGDELPSESESQQLAELIWKLRPIAQTAILSVAERELNTAVQKRLGDKLSRVIENLDHNDHE